MTDDRARRMHVDEDGLEGPMTVHDLSAPCTAVQLVEIDREGDIDSDLLIVPEEALDSLRASALDLKSVIEEYSMMLMVQTDEMKKEMRQCRGADAVVGKAR